MGRSIATLAFLAVVLPLAACDGGGSGAPEAGKPDLTDTGLAHRIATLETRTASIEQSADGVDGRIDVVEGTADAVQARLVSAGTQIDATRVDLIQEIEDVESDLDDAVDAFEPLRIVRGRVGAFGDLLAGEGFSAELLHVTFDVPFAEPPTIVCTSTDDAVVSVIARSETEFQVRVLKLDWAAVGLGGQVAVEPGIWDFIAIGK